MFERRIFSKENFLQLIKNSENSEVFRNYYVDAKDILEDGNLSCAFFVSSLLVLSGYLERISFTVEWIETQIQSLNQVFSPREITDIQEWDIIIWWASEFSNKRSHIGFALNSVGAMSNSSELRKITQHSKDYDGNRPVLRAYSYLFKN